MSYGLVGDNTDTYGPTLQGMRILRQAVLEKGLAYPTMYGFVNNGYTDHPQELSQECIKFAKDVKDESLLSTVKNLQSAASTSKTRLALC